MARDVGHAGIIFYSQGAPEARLYWTSETDAFMALTCPHCGRAVSAAVVAATYSDYPLVKWVRCPHCSKGAVFNGGVVSPSPLPGEEVEGLSSDVSTAYREARTCIGAGAFTAGELMCRKILMHIAVDNGADEQKPFAFYVDYLEGKGFFTPYMKPWVDQIRKNANFATHEIPATDKRRAENTLAFTVQLLRLVYEMAYRTQQFAPDES